MRKRVAVLRGGPSSEYEVSLKTGKSVIETLNNIDKYVVLDITIDQKGNWFLDGISVVPTKVLRDVDLVWNAMHGEYGEDGKVQQILESINVPFTGPTTYGANLSMNKARTKEIYEQHGLKTPHYKILEKTDDISALTYDLYRTFPIPAILKPIDKGSSVGIYVCDTHNDIRENLEKAFESSDKVLLEEYISGKEGTVGVVDNFRDERVYPLLPIEIKPPAHKDFFDYECKYDGSTEEICPGNFSRKESALMQESAQKAHEALGLRHYSRTDFIVHPKRGVFLIETNSLPGMTSESLFPKGLKPVGSSYEEFLEHVVEMASN